MAGITFTAAAAAKIRKATERVLNSPPSLTPDQKTRLARETTFWGMILGTGVTGLHYQFLRVTPTFDVDSRADFTLSNGTAYRFADESDDRDVGIAREANGNKSVPNFTVALMQFVGFDRDGEPAYLFAYAFDRRQVVLPIHDHRDNLSGGFSFSVYHPGTSLPQQPWAQ